MSQYAIVFTFPLLSVIRFKIILYDNNGQLLHIINARNGICTWLNWLWLSLFRERPLDFLFLFYFIFILFFWDGVGLGVWQKLSVAKFRGKNLLPEKCNQCLIWPYRYRLGTGIKCLKKKETIRYCVMCKTFWLGEKNIVPLKVKCSVPYCHFQIYFSYIIAFSWRNQETKQATNTLRHMNLWCRPHYGWKWKSQLNWR
jgi:hypothetical protein